MSDDDDDVTWTIKRQKRASASDDNSEVVDNTEVASDPPNRPCTACGMISATCWTANSEVVVNSPESPNVPIAMEEYDLILEDTMIQKIINECQKQSYLSLETMIHNVCQDVTITLMSLEWQKELHRVIQRSEPHLK